jgi:hypothetical protein
MLPGLLKRLNAGMQMVAADDETRKRFFGKLMRCHTKVMSNAAGVSSVRVASAAAAADSAGTANAAAPAAAVPVTATGEAQSVGAHPPVLTDAVAPQAPTLDFGDLSAPPVPTAPESTAPAAAPLDEDTEPAAAPPEFTAVTIHNPFGEGDIEVEEISVSDLPPGAGLPANEGDPASGGDEHSRLVKGLTEGAWIEFRDDDDNRRPARLSYISPLKGTYLFVNRQGKKVGEYSLYQLAREFRTGRASILDAVPLFDRAMGSLVGALRASTTPH